MAHKTTKGKVTAEIVAGLAVVGAAAAAGYYFYGSKQAKQHRGVAVKWATDMKKEVIREAKHLKEIDAKEFAKVVDTVMKTYLKIRSVDAKDVKRAASELKSNWKVVLHEAKKSGSKKTVAKAKKTARKGR